MAHDFFDSIVIGAGLAGLSCALKLEAMGFNVCLLEGGDKPGGRVTSDNLDGFILDRGFQVLLTGYPEAARMLDYKKLALKPFYSGALIQDGRTVRLSDPFRQPGTFLPMLLSDVASLSDKLKIAYLRQKVMATSISEIFAQPDATIAQHLKNLGFSSEIVRRFFTPFFGGITLDRSLSGSARMFEFIYKMMAEGQVAVPAGGMGAISDQLASGLKPGTLRLKSRVSAVDQERLQVTLQDKTIIQARSIIMAAQGPEAAKLLPQINPPQSLKATCLYFDAPRAPFPEPMLLLNAEGGLINNLAVMSNVAPSYAPPGRSLISVTVLGDAEKERLKDDVIAELKNWFGEETSLWRHLRTYLIEHAQPQLQPGQMPRPSRLTEGNIYVCGDYCENASINGALLSGRKAAEAVAADLKIAVLN